MKKKTVRSALIAILAMFCAGFFVPSTSFADPPSTLVVVRSSTDALWKATCTGLTCSAFTIIPGEFASQPTLSWDDALQRYVLIGRSSSGALWRSTFASNGNFYNDWTLLSGSSPSPAAVASRVLTDYSPTYGTTSNDKTMTSYAEGAGVNILTKTMYPPSSSGYYQCTATAMASFDRANTSGDNVLFFGLSETSGSLASNSRWTAIDLPDGTPAGLTTIPISVTAWFYSSSAASINFYNVASWGGVSAGDPIYIRQPAMHCEYYRD